MLTELRYIESQSTNPYENLALEEYLLNTCPPHCCILYLWQNRQTVVIGKNQNAYRECRWETLEQDGGHLARRLSGGGAVYHDVGNLNFTFLLPTADYDVQRQLAVIVAAVRELGLPAVLSGRNDITVHGRKFSGNAFYHHADRSYHHGTILLNVDTTCLARYLRVSEAKLQSKGVASVQSRVANLCEFCPDLTVAEMKQRLIAAFGQVYGNQPQALATAALDSAVLAELTAKYASAAWRIGRQVDFSGELAERFSWGEVQISCQVQQGKVADCAVYSDAMDEQYIAALPELWRGCEFSGAALAQSLPLAVTMEQQQIRTDLAQLLIAKLDGANGSN